MSRGWHGVDLDGTLAEYNGWKGMEHIGEPIPKMLERVKKWIEGGEQVKIFTARVSVPYPEPIIKVIEDWCVKHIGQKLEVTNKKDFSMWDCWDDRAVQIIKNTGERVDGNQ